MTGFGHGEVKKNGKEISVEVRTLNNRFLDISVRLPKALSLYEEEIRNIVKQNLSRGRVNVVLNIKEANDDKDSLGRANIELARSYLNQLENIQKELKIGGKIKLDHLIAFSDIFLLEEEQEDSTETWDEIKEALIIALDNLKQMRLTEGEQLGIDLINRIKSLDDNIKEIERLSRSRIEKERDKLSERIAFLGVSKEIDESRMELEIALLASRMDVTEECIRFKSHNKIFLDSLNATEAAGRKLNFLLQEMTREANTIGAKACDADISHLVVNIKEEVEKIREQVQNIE